MTSMVHLICALNCEAEPLRAYYRLKQGTESGLFKTYSNPDARITLTVSGTGKINAAAATSYTHEYYHALKSDAWLNIGIAGHQSLDIGQAVLAHKIIDISSNTTWYPQIIFSTPCPSSTLKTLDKPSSEYEEHLFDMEAAGFFAIASRVTTCEIVHVLKIISDNKSYPASKLDKAVVLGLIANQIDTIDSIIDSLQQLSRELAAVFSPPREYHACLEHWHFTWYERRTLHYLLIRWQVLFPGTSILKRIGNISDGRQFIQLVQEKLDNTPILY